jgi:hypothetical protein
LVLRVSDGVSAALRDEDTLAAVAPWGLLAGLGARVGASIRESRKFGTRS